MSKERLKIIRVIAAMAWSDGYLDQQEKDRLRLLSKHMELSESEKSELEDYFNEPPSLQDISFDELNAVERNAVYLLAAHYAYRDGLVWSGEQKLLDTIAEMLHLSPEIRNHLEQQVKVKRREQ